MYYIIAYRTLFLYIFIVICYRIMGKKEVGELGIIDLIVSFSIAELASISIEEVDKSIWTSILPISILTIIEISMSYFGMKIKRFRNLSDGVPTVIINNGKLNYQGMKKIRYTVDDLLTQLREKDIASIKDIKYAILETDGKLSIFKNGNYPFPIIEEGKINKETIKNISKDENWILNKVNKIDDILYAYYFDDNLYIIKYDDTY